MSAPILRADGSSFERVLDALGDYVTRVRSHGRHADARCPAHDDNEPSLSIDWKNNPAKGGLTVVKCHGPGCDARDVLDEVGLSLSDTYDTEPYGGRRTAGPSSSKPVRPTKHTPARPKAKRPPLGPIEASYPYCNADGVVVGEFRRHRGKQFRWKKAGAAGELVDGQPKPCPLYLLPDVLAAVREGRTVHLAEGEKDADALRAAGEVATTIPNGVTVQQDGAAKNLTTDHLDALRGAHVVIWADRDGPDAKKPERGYQGYRHAMRMVRELADVAASVRVVEALAGKDAYDHLDAGHALSDAVAIDPADRVPADILARWGEAPASSPTGDDGEGQGADVYDFPTRPHAGGDARRGGGGGGGDSDGRVREVYVKDEYEVYNGCLVQVKRHAATKHKLAEIVRTEILNAHARMTRQVVRDLGADVDAEPLVDLEVTSPDGESYTLRSLPRKDFEDPSKWTGKVPLPLTFPRGPMKGRLANAIIATSGAIPVETAYGLLGWHEIAPGEWAYLHAAGAIGKDGPLLGTRVEVSPRLRGFKLPPEIPAGDALRRSYDAVMAIAEHLPAHLAYPLIAIGCRAVLGDCATPVMAVGSPGTYKSGSVALIQQMYMPTSRYDRMPAGLGEDSSTGGAAEQLLHEAGHGVLTIDDSAPDRGVARAAARVAALIRAVANRQSKARLERDTSKGLRADKPPRALAVLTGEDQPTVQSAERRVVYLPFRGGDVSIEDLEAASAPWMIEARSGLTAALAQRVAAMMPNADWLAEQRTHWSKWFAAADDRDMTDGLVVSRCNTVADLWIGLRTMLEHVVEAGVVTRAEAAQHQHDALAAFRDLLSVQFDLTEGRTLSERFAHLVRSALTSGRAHLQHPDGGKPVHADRFGWQATITDKESKAGGAAIGWTDGETVWMNPGPAYAAAEMEGRAQADALDVTQRALKKHLVQAHPDAFEPAKGHGLPLEKRATLSGVRQRVYALPYSWLYPDDVDDDNGDQGAAPVDPPPLPFEPAADPSPAGPSSDGPPPSGASTTAAEGTPATGAATATNGPQKAAERPAEPPKAARAPEGPRERRQRRYKAAGVVVDVDGAYLVNGSGPVELPDVGSFSELLDWALTLDLGVHHAGDTKARAEGVRDDAGLVVVMPKLARKLGAPKRAPDRDKPPAAAKKAVKALTEDGWKVGQRGLAPYTQVWKVNGDGRHGRSHFLVFAGWSVDPIFRNLPTAAQVAYRLTLYVDTLGYQLVYSAGATGTTLLRQTRAGTPRPLVDAVTEVPPPASNRDLAPIEDLEWDYWRELTDDEQATCDVLVGMDVNASYLTAAASTVVGYGPARHVERPSLDELRGIPGYALLDPIGSPPADPLLPDLLDMHASVTDSRHARRDGKPFTVTAPMLAALLEAGERPTVREAWVYDARDEKGQQTWGRHLQTWSHTLRDAIYLLKRDPAAADDPDAAAALDELKLTYAAGLGRLASERYSKGRSVWLPYWDHATKASAQASIWRKVAKTAAATGRHPVGIARDTIYYAATSTDGELPTHDAAMALLPTGVKGGFIYDGPDAYVIGHVKWSGSATAAAYRDALAVTDIKAQMHAIESIWTTPKMIGRSE